MEFKSLLKKEHGFIKRNILELEKVIPKKMINLNYVKTKFMDLILFWDTHEEKEDVLISDLKEKFPKEKEIEKFITNNKHLKGHKTVISNALKSRDQIKVKVALDTDGRMLFDKLKTHMRNEELLFLR